jgi:ABC-type nitrate/sulfonate/bicarbonate transport systems, periplasmic components
VAMNDALLSRSLDIASGGVTVFLTVWDKTRTSFGVKGVAILNALPMYLVTANPNVHTLKDFSDKDRIAVTAVKISTMAVTLQMAAEQLLGENNHAAFDKLTVSMRHPDAMAALKSGVSEVNSYFGTPPFQQQAMEFPGVRKILSSYDVLGGPATFNMLWTRGDFHDQNPRLYGAFLAALREAQALINADPDEATRIYLVEDNSKLDAAFIRSLIVDPASKFTTTPLNSMKYATFLHKIGTIRSKPESWKELFFPELHDEPGS